MGSKQKAANLIRAVTALGVGVSLWLDQDLCYGPTAYHTEVLIEIDDALLSNCAEVSGMAASGFSVKLLCVAVIASVVSGVVASEGEVNT